MTEEARSTNDEKAVSPSPYPLRGRERGTAKLPVRVELFLTSSFGFRHSDSKPPKPTRNRVIRRDYSVRPFWLIVEEMAYFRFRQRALQLLASGQASGDVSPISRASPPRPPGRAV